MDTQMVPLTAPAVDALRSRLRGNVLLPADGGYDRARVLWNGMIERHPALIVQASGTADVITAVNFARETGLPLAVRGGGHSLPGLSSCDGGVMLDLLRMRAVRVDPERRIAWVQGGALWADVDHETQAFGLAVTGGQVSHTGVGGLTTGGGIGNLMRACGATVDNLLGADVVTADGALHHASVDEHPDLFWAIRGGGGNFGVVTEFEFRLHQVGPIVTGGLIAFPLSEAQQVLRNWRDYMANAPDEVQVVAALITAPPAPFVPEDLRFKPIVSFLLCSIAPPETSATVISDIRSFGTPVLDMLGPIPYTVLQTLLDDAARPGQRNYLKGGSLRRFPDEAIDVVVEEVSRMPSPFAITVLVPYGGAISRVGELDTAFGNRDTAFSISIFAIWHDPAGDAENMEWARAFHEAIHPWITGVYVNEVHDDYSSRVHEVYPPETYHRLATIKARYDPGNLFHLNQNIKPEIKD